MHDNRHYDSPLGRLHVGLEIPEVVRLPTKRTLVKFACAAGDFYEIHYDAHAARAAGLPGIIVHGSLKGAYLAHAITQWLGDNGRLTRIEVRYRAIDFPGGPYRCRGVIAAIHPGRVDLEVWGEKLNGERTTTGSATVAVAVRAVENT